MGRNPCYLPRDVQLSADRPDFLTIFKDSPEARGIVFASAARPGGRDGQSSGTWLCGLGDLDWRRFRLGRASVVRHQRDCADSQRHLPGDHALSAGPVGTAGPVAVVWLALVHPRLAFPAPRLTSACLLT